MKFTVNKHYFGHALQQVCSIVGTRTLVPGLSNVLLEIDQQQLTLATTNFDLSIRCRCSIKTESTGSIALPVRKLLTVIRSLSATEVVVDISRHHQARITSGSSEFKIMGTEKSQFPELPNLLQGTAVEFDQEEFQIMLRNVAYAQSSNANRKILNGVCFNIKNNQLTLVSTDGKRLALHNRAHEFNGEFKESIVIPTKTVNELQRLLGQGSKLLIRYTGRQVSFDVDTNKDSGLRQLIGSTSLISKLVEGQYPDFLKVVPKTINHKVKLQRDYLQQCIKRASLMTNDEYNSIMLTFAANTLQVKSCSPEFGEFIDTMEIAYDGPAISLAFNPQYILDPLKSLTVDEISFGFNDEYSPGVITTTEGYTCVIMPLRINRESIPFD